LTNGEVIPAKSIFMKNLAIFLFVFAALATTNAQDSNTQNLGDNFSLEGALAMFKTSSSLEAFEAAINEENNNVNNLDLNEDGNIDYVHVADIMENDAHVIVLSTYLNGNEKQDIATIGIEKTGDASAVLQIIGDEDLYPENTIVEPYDAEESPGTSKGGPSFNELEWNRIVVNVWGWPCVRFMYAPRYIAYVSPFRWGHYPPRWRPWRPFKQSLFYTRCAPHRVYYHRAPTRRVVYATKIYRPNRHTSTIVVQKRNSRTIIHQNKRGNTKVIKTTRKPDGRRRRN
jgi:hypothetical protein